MPTRRRARTIAFQILYSMIYNPVEVEDAAARYFLLEKERKKPIPPFAVELAHTVRAHEPELDSRIDAHLHHWKPERVSHTERVLLRLACAELLFHPDIPPRVTLDEYIELARQFGDEGAPGFVNAILDAIFKSEIAPETPEAETLATPPPPPPLASPPTAPPPPTAAPSVPPAPPLSPPPAPPPEETDPNP